jgi:hypothetical protein
MEKKIYQKTQSEFNFKKKKIGKHINNLGKYKQNSVLYRIENYLEIANNSRFNKLLIDWLDEHTNGNLRGEKENSELYKEPDYNELQYL